MRGALHMVLVLSVVLSGCVGGDDNDASTEPDTPDDGVVVTDADGQTRIVRPHIVSFTDQSAYTHTESEDGTFELGQHWDLNGEVLNAAGHDNGYIHVRDITDKVPTGIPVRIAIELNAELEEGDLDIWLDMPQEDVWTFSADAPIGGYSRLEYGVVATAGETIDLVVFYDEPEPAQSFDYLVTYEIEAQPFLLLPGVPVSVPVPRGATSIDAAFNGTDTGHLLVFDPQDQLVARVAATDGVANHTLASGAAVGDYVVMLDGRATGPAHLFVYAPAPEEGDPAPLPYGTVTQDIQAGSAEAFAANEDVEFTFDTTRTPLQVGIQIQVQTVADGYDVTLAGPDGALFANEDTFMPPLWELSTEGSIGFGFLTAMGTEGLGVGTYTGTFSADTHGDGEAYGWIVHYER